MKNLAQANARFQKRYPGDTPERQPVHTVYGGAHLFKADTAQKLSEKALEVFNRFAPSAEALTSALGILDVLTAPNRKMLFERVKSKLEKEAVEDFRIDFEDGYGNRPDKEEDAMAQEAASEVAKGLSAGALPPYIGIRIKPWNAELVKRSKRTLEIFLTTLVKSTKGKLPQGFVITLPKVTVADQLSAFVAELSRMEKKLKLKSGSIPIEFMIETAQSILGPDGRSPLPSFLDASKGRCRGAHFGTYDYTASCNITAQYQEMDHPACMFALQLMKVAYSGTGIWLSDGATNVMPVGSPEVVLRAWRLSYKHIRNSLRNGYYQGWDLHPSQLVVRYAAVYSYFLESLAAASERLKNFISKAAQATLVGDVFDDAATGQGLLNYFLRAINCGAITEHEILATGLTLDEVRAKSFVNIMKARQTRN